MSTATLEEHVRTIQGRRIERQSQVDKFTGERYWQFIEINRLPPIEKRSYNEAIGQDMTIIEHREQRVLWDSGPGPGEVFQATLARLDTSHNPFHPSILEFDPRPASPLHDQLERARSSGFADLAEAFEIAAKVHERPGVIRGRFPLGRCWCTRGVSYDASTARKFLAEHVTQEAPELDDDARWCPVLAGIHAENAVAIETGRGLVRSRFGIEIPEMRGPIYPTPTGRTTTIYVHIWTLLGGPDKTMTLLH
jgi:hypothetical protein